MTAPTARVRNITRQRDVRCLRCGALGNLEWNHRQNSGMGGRGSKAAKVTPADGVMLCRVCNQQIEADPEAQKQAILAGWKVRKWSPVLPAVVPVYYPLERSWFLLNRDGTRDELNAVETAELRSIAGTLPRLETGAH